MTKEARTKLKAAAGDPDLVKVVIDEVRGWLAVVGRRRDELLDGHYDPELASSAAALSRVLLAAIAEQRAQRAAITKLSLETVLEWLDVATEEDRAALARAIQRASEMESLL